MVSVCVCLIVFVVVAEACSLCASAVQENRMRLREEARRQRLVEKRKEEVKQDIILKVPVCILLGNEKRDQKPLQCWSVPARVSILSASFANR